MNNQSEQRELWVIILWSILCGLIFTSVNLNSNSSYKKTKNSFFKISYSIGNYDPTAHRDQYIKFVARKDYYSRSASAFLLGKKLAPHEFRESFKENGLIHLLTPSAIHMVFVCGVFVLFLTPILNSIFSIKKKSAVMLCILIISSTLYLQWSGFQESAGRASLILLIFSSLGVLRKSYSGFQILFLFSLLIFMLLPSETNCLSFQYSLMAYLALAVSRKLKKISLISYYLNKPASFSLKNKFIKPTNSWISILFSKTTDFILPKLKEVLFIQLVISLYLSSIQFSLGQSPTPWGLLLNPLVIPFTILITLPLSLASFLIFPISIGFSDFFLRLSAGSTMALSELINQKLYILIMLVSLYLILKINILKSTNRSLKFIKIFIIFIGILFPSHIGLTSLSKLEFLNVGQGDSMVLSSRNCNLYVDLGKYRKFKKQWIPKMRSNENVIITHPHADHYGGLSILYESGRRPTIYIPRLSFRFPEVISLIRYSSRESSNPIKIKFLKRGKNKLSLCATNIDLFVPESDSKDPNDISPLIMFSLSHDLKIASLGDLSIKEFEYLQWIHRKKFCKKVDLLKISHHGSKYSTSREHFHCFKPKMSLISSSKNNSYGHPHPNVLNLIKEYKSKALLTNRGKGFKWIMDEPGVWKCINCNKSSETN